MEVTILFFTTIACPVPDLEVVGDVLRLLVLARPFSNGILPGHKLSRITSKQQSFVTPVCFTGQTHWYDLSITW